MKFEQQSVSDKYEHWTKTPDEEAHYIEINTLDELLEYVKKEKHFVIIQNYVFRKSKGVRWSLQTYDGYLE